MVTQVVFHLKMYLVHPCLHLHLHLYLHLQVRRLPPSFFQLPAQALAARLEGVAPPGGGCCAWGAASPGGGAPSVAGGGAPSVAGGGAWGRQAGRAVTRLTGNSERRMLAFATSIPTANPTTPTSTIPTSPSPTSSSAVRQGLWLVDTASNDVPEGVWLHERLVEEGVAEVGSLPQGVPLLLSLPLPLSLRWPRWTGWRPGWWPGRGCRLW